jgi:cytochrome c oxidase subunit IV
LRIVIGICEKLYENAVMIYSSAQGWLYNKSTTSYLLDLWRKLLQGEIKGNNDIFRIS